MNSPISKEPLIKYGPIEGIVLLGGGQLLGKICLWAKSEGVPIKVVTAQRHADEVTDNKTLSACLSRNKVKHIVVDDIAHPSVKEFIGNTANLFCLSVGGAWIFKENIISSYFDDKLFNLHGTRLPQNRGGGGFSWQIMMGNRFGFCVLHRISGGIDTGDIVSFEEYIYPPTCRKPIDYSKVYIEKNLAFIIDFIEEFRSSTLPLRPIAQSEYFSTYWPRLHTDLNGWIDWSTDALELERFICAFDEPYAGAQTYLNGKRVRIKSVCLSPQDGIFHSYQSGLIYRKSKDWFCVSIKGSTLIVEDIFDDNGNSIVDDVRVGDRFITPTQELENAKSRPLFTPQGLKSKD